MSSSKFESYLRSFNENEWLSAVKTLLPLIHEVDRNAVQVWFRFYPLSLQRFISAASNTDEAKRSIAMQGDFGLENRIDTSHTFLYGHRYWGHVKTAIDAEAVAFENEDIALADMIRRVATKAAENSKADASLVIAITAVGLMTCAQVGVEQFQAAAGNVTEPSGLLAKGPDAVAESRRRDDSQGLLGFLKTVDKKFSVIHDERRQQRFEIMNDQEIASASANDRSQNWQDKDPRCWEGPVPVECTSASCGTCWVGVLGGENKLSEVARREGRAMKVFGYDQSEEARPVIRLACQAKAYGNVTIVIPPWNAVFGKKVYGNVEELELEPATTSAKKLRETISSAASQTD